MGTTNKDGTRLTNKVVISRGGNVPARKINLETGETDRSFAQPNPTVKHVEPEAKVHASEQDKSKALEDNSKLGRKHTVKDEPIFGEVEEKNPREDNDSKNDGS